MHPWEVVAGQPTIVEMIDNRKAWTLLLACERCGAEKKISYSPGTGEIIGRHGIHYPNEYLVIDLPAWGGRRQLNNNVRQELIGRYAPTNSKKKG